MHALHGILRMIVSETIRMTPCKEQLQCLSFGYSFLATAG